MSVQISASGSALPSGVSWREVPGIYKARLKRLWQVMRLSLLASALLFVTIVLAPFLFAFALFSSHVILTSIGVGLVLLVAGRMMWMSFKLALSDPDR